MSEKLKPNSVLRLDFDLKIQKEDSNFTFFKVILINIDSSFKYTQWSYKSSTS